MPPCCDPWTREPGLGPARFCASCCLLPGACALTQRDNLGRSDFVGGPEGIHLIPDVKPQAKVYDMEILHAGLMLDKERKGLWKTGERGPLPRNSLVNNVG